MFGYSALRGASQATHHSRGLSVAGLFPRSVLPTLAPHLAAVKLFDHVRSAVFRHRYGNHLTRVAQEAHARVEFGGVTCYLSGAGYGSLKQVRGEVGRCVGEFATSLKVFPLPCAYLPLFKAPVGVGLVTFTPTQHPHMPFYGLDATVVLHRPPGMTRLVFHQAFEEALRRANALVRNTRWVAIPPVHRAALLRKAPGVETLETADGVYLTGNCGAAVDAAASALRLRLFEEQQRVRYVPITRPQPSGTVWRAFTAELRRILAVTGVAVALTAQGVRLTRSTSGGSATGGPAALFLDDAEGLVVTRVARMGLAPKPPATPRAAPGGVSERGCLDGSMETTAMPPSACTLIPAYLAAALKGPQGESINAVIQAFGVRVEFANHTASAAGGSAGDFRVVLLFGPPARVEQAERLLTAKVALLCDRLRPRGVAVPDAFFHPFVTNKGRLLHAVEKATGARVVKEGSGAEHAVVGGAGRVHTLTVSAPTVGALDRAERAIGAMVRAFAAHERRCALPLDEPELGFVRHNAHLLGIYAALRRLTARYAGEGIYLGFDLAVVVTAATDRPRLGHVQRVVNRLIGRFLCRERFSTVRNVSRSVACLFIGQNALAALRIRDETGAVVQIRESPVLEGATRSAAPAVAVVVYGATVPVLQLGVARVAARLRSVESHTLHVPLVSDRLPLNPRVVLRLAVMRYGLGLASMQKLDPHATITWNAPDLAASVVCVYHERPEAAQGLASRIEALMKRLNELTVVVEIPDSLVPVILGLKGEAMQRLWEQSGCLVYLVGERNGSEAAGAGSDAVGAGGGDCTSGAVGGGWESAVGAGVLRGPKRQVLVSANSAKRVTAAVAALRSLLGLRLSA